MTTTQRQLNIMIEPRSSVELESARVGDLVKVLSKSGNDDHWMVYEGVIEDREAFMFLFPLFGGEPPLIQSRRIRKRLIILLIGIRLGRHFLTGQFARYYIGREHRTRRHIS